MFFFLKKISEAGGNYWNNKVTLLSTNLEMQKTGNVEDAVLY